MARNRSRDGLAQRSAVIVSSGLPCRESTSLEEQVKIAIVLAAVLGALVALVWLGLRVSPRSFPTFPRETCATDSRPLPEGLPAPVDRFYRQVFGERVPVIKSAVVSGLASLRLRGITFPGRFRFTYDAGKGYRHYIETTLYGLPVMRVNERYLDGKSRLELPFGIVEEGPRVDQGANLGLWAESIWLPSVLITAPRVRWEAIDDETALLIVPFEDSEERFVARFDPTTGMLHMLESMRYRGSESETKTLWLNEARRWDTVDGNLLPVIGAVTWFGDPAPWATFTVTEVVYNADVTEYIRAHGL